MAARGEISDKVVAEWESETPDELPERIEKKASKPKKRNPWKKRA